MRILTFFFMNAPQNGHRRYLSCIQIIKKRKGCAHMERIKNDLMQQVRMCVQTYFNLYGSAPSEQVMREWLGTSYGEKIPEYLNQMFAA